MKKVKIKGTSFLNKHVFSRSAGSFFAKTLLLLLFFLLISMSSYALLSFEPTNGPWGGHVNCIKISSNRIIYIGTVGGGIFKSTNYGGEWRWKATGITNSSNLIKDIETSGTEIAFAALEGLGVFKSSDRGETWWTKYSGLQDLYVNDIAVDKDNLVYVATETRGVHKSTDVGESWSTTALSAEVSPITCLAVNESGATVIYAGTGIPLGQTISNGIWKSTNQALSWTRISTAELDTEEILTIAVYRSNPDIVYTGISGRVWRSTDGGGTWEATNIDKTATSIIVDPSDSDVLYVSVDGNSGGLFKSTDGGASYEALDLGGEKYFKDVAIDPSYTSHVYAGNYGSGIFKSTDAGATTFEVSNTGINNLIIRCLEIASVGAQSILYAAGEGMGANKLGLFKSTDDGMSWNHIDSLDRTKDIYKVFVDPWNQEHIYVGTSNGPPCLYRSTDSGGTWQAINVGDKKWFITMTADPHSSGTFYAGTCSQEVSDSSLALANNVFRSTDDGLTWQLWGQGLRTDAWIPTWYYAHPFCIHAAKGTEETVVFLGAGGYNIPVSIYRSPSGSVGSWESASYNITYVFHAYVTNIVDIPTRETVYMSYNIGAMRKKSIYDDDITWTTIVSTLPGRCDDFEVDIENPYKYYITSRYSWSGAPQLHFFSFDENRDPLRVEENFGLPSLNITNFPEVPDQLLSPYVTHIMSAWPVEIDPNSPKDERVLFTGLPGRSVWRAETIAEMPPVPPSNFSGSAEGTDRIRWRWQDNSITELGFKLYSYPEENLIAEIPMNTTSTLEGGLLTNYPYARMVAAYNTAGQSFSDYDETYTLANVPGVPQAMVGNVWISLTWEANGNPEGTKYQVHRSTSEAITGYPFDWKLLTTTETRSYYDMGLTPEAKYWYKLYAINGDGILAGPTEDRWFETISGEPSADVFPPEIDEIRFDERLYFEGIYGEGDIIFKQPRITARITDRGSGEVGQPGYVTPEGVNINSVKINIEDVWHFDISSEALSTSETEHIVPLPIPPPVRVYLDYVLPISLGPGTYSFVMEAKDMAYPWFNRGEWTGTIRIMGPKVETVGPTLAHPTPYKPLTHGDVTISYTLSTNANVSIFMYDTAGQVVMNRNYMAGTEGGKAGYNGITWNGISDVSGGYVGNGIYVYKIVSGGKLIGTGKLVVFE